MSILIYIQICLFKFVRLAGDLLLPPLFIPYIKMLLGLSNGPQCAHQCFNLLKMNGASGGSLEPTTSLFLNYQVEFSANHDYFLVLNQINEPK